MSDAHLECERVFGEQLESLTTEIRQLSDSSPQAALALACERLAEIKPFSSAGIFRLDASNNNVEWVHLAEASDEKHMHSAPRQNLTDLSGMRTDSRAVQFASEGEPNPGPRVFVGVPAGNYDGALTGLGLHSTRTLHDAELARLAPIGMLLGLLTENARLNSLVSRIDEPGSTARLIGYIAHELRTPLTGMRGNIQLALMANRKNEHDRIPKRLEAAINGVDDMSLLVQRLLDVSRLERGAFSLSLSQTNIERTITAALDSVADDEDFISRPIRVIEMESITLEHDAAAMQQVLRLLLIMMSRYVDDSGEIALSVQSTGDEMRLTISYDGLPLSEDDHDALSTPLSNSDSSSARSDGLSLDLAFARGIIREHQGKISIGTDSASPNRPAIDILLPLQIS